MTNVTHVLRSIRTRFAAGCGKPCEALICAIVDMTVQWCACNSAEFSYSVVVEFHASKKISTEV